MKLKAVLVTLSALMAGASFAQTPAAAPAAAAVPASPAAGVVTALCKDGTNFSGDTKKGACSGHKGVKTWTSKNEAKADTSATPAVTTESKADAKAKSKAAGAKASAPLANAAPGGGAGKVWLNPKSNVYHCSGDKYYGRTKEGSYMSEAEAKAKGAHGDHGKACAG
jgi:hypothetical protein